jgi:hypothetical protein
LASSPCRWDPWEIPWEIPKTHGKCREIQEFSWKNAVFIGGKYVGRWIYVAIFVPLGWAFSSPDLPFIFVHCTVSHDISWLSREWIFRQRIWLISIMNNDTILYHVSLYIII